MKRAKWFVALLAGAAFLAATPTASGSTDQVNLAPDATASSKNAYFNSWGTCANAKPYKPPRRFCTYDRGNWFRGTFILKTRPGNKVMMKACFRIFSRPPLGGRHGCGQSRMALKYKAFPFWVRGVRQAFKVRILWYAKAEGSGGKFTPAGRSWMTVRP